MSSFFFPEITVVMLLFHPYGKLTSVDNGVIAWSVWKNETTPLLRKHDSKIKDGQELAMWNCI